MKILINEKLSEHKYKTPEGYLVCVDSILARTGKQTYQRDELFHDGDSTEVEVDRTPEEVFSEATLASFENKPVTVEHPDEDVNVSNYKDYAVGFVRDVKRGVSNGQDVILGTLVITDEQTIQEIENGEHTDLSCGYDCDILDEENPSQKNIRGNHVALCQQGRAGIARIVDSVKDAKYCVELDNKGYVWQTYITASSEKEAGIKAHKLYKDPVRNVYKVEDSIDDANKLPSKDRKFIANYLRMISTFTNRDVDIKDLLRPLSGHGYNWTIEKIEGWKWKQGEYAYKNYYISINGYDDRFLVTLYADPNQDWKVKEVNAYFIDSVNDSIDYSNTEVHDDQHIELIRGNHERDQILAVYQSDIDENLYFYVGKKYCMREGEFSYNKYVIKSSPQAIMRELEKNGWHKVSRGPAPFIDSVNDSTYKCEFKLNGDTMWTYVKADSPEDAKREILDKFASAKEISVSSHDSVDDSTVYRVVEKKSRKPMTGGSDFVSEYWAEQAIVNARKAAIQWPDDVKWPDGGYEIIEVHDSVDDTKFKFKIEYDKGKPGIKSEIIEVSSYKEARDYAANHAHGWGFEVINVNDSISDATRKELIQKLKTASVPYGKRLTIDDKSGWSLDIQHVGSWENTGKFTPAKEEARQYYPKSSRTLSSEAWGRLWYNGELMQQFRGPINVVKADMIKYLNSQMKDSKAKLDSAMKVVNIVKATKGGK